MKPSLTNSKSPEVSIITVNYKTPDLVIKSLRAISEDDHLPPCQIIVVDNASHDRSVDDIKKNFPGFTLIESNTNLGLSKADNLALKKANGKYILLLNSDAFLSPGALQLMVDYLQNHPNTGAVSPRLLNADGTTQPSCFPDISVISSLRAYWFGAMNLVEKYAPSSPIPSQVEMVVSSAILIRRDLLERLGGEDERFFLYFQDLDLCRRINKSGYSIVYHPTATVTHLHGASGQTKMGFGYLKETLLYPFKVLSGQWHPTTSQEYFLEGSIRYFGWLRHLLITLLIKYSPNKR